MSREPMTIDVRQDGNGLDVRGLVRAGHPVTLYDSASIFPPFEILADGAAFRVEPSIGIAYGLFADVDDALRFGLTNRTRSEGDHADRY